MSLLGERAEGFETPKRKYQLGIVLAHNPSSGKLEWVRRSRDSESATEGDPVKERRKRGRGRGKEGEGEGEKAHLTILKERLSLSFPLKAANQMFYSSRDLFCPVFGCLVL